MKPASATLAGGDAHQWRIIDTLSVARLYNLWVPRILYHLITTATYTAATSLLLW
jgi:hypothetical protein